MSFSNYWARQLMLYSFGYAGVTQPTIYIALSSTAPTEAGVFTEQAIGTGAYARILTTGGTGGDWTVGALADPATVTSANDESFPAATADWLAGATITDHPLTDAATGGNMLLNMNVTSGSRSVLNGDTYTVLAGNFDFTLD